MIEHKVLFDDNTISLYTEDEEIAKRFKKHSQKMADIYNSNESEKNKTIQINYLFENKIFKEGK